VGLTEKLFDVVGEVETELDMVDDTEKEFVTVAVADIKGRLAR
jgi:hypothetical protein